MFLRVVPAADSDAAELADVAAQLQDELRELDIPSVGTLTSDAVPASAKGTAPLFGWLVAQFGTLEGLKAVMAAVAGWTTRTGRTVEVSLGGDTLKISKATPEQQRELIDAWLARHSAGT